MLICLFRFERVNDANKRRALATEALERANDNNNNNNNNDDDDDDDNNRRNNHTKRAPVSLAA